MEKGIFQIPGKEMVLEYETIPIEDEWEYVDPKETTVSQEALKRAKREPILGNRLTRIVDILTS